MTAPRFPAGSFLDLGAHRERRLDRLEVAAHRLVGAELGSVAALPDRRGDAVRHPASRLIGKLMRRHVDQNAVRQLLAPGFADEPGNPLPELL